MEGIMKNHIKFGKRLLALCLTLCTILTVSTITTINTYAAGNETDKVSLPADGSGQTGNQADTQASNLPPAEKISINLATGSGTSASKLLDGSYDTYVSLTADDTITITADQAMYGIYIIWGAPTDEWTLTYNGVTKTFGQHGYIHEYCAIPEGTTSCTITLAKGERLCDIYAYTNGKLPDDVQVWTPPCDNADILVFSTHADDEILFLGGVLATYGGQQNLRVQLVYLCNYWDGQRVREHEKLDGLWASGIRHYPVNAPFGDYYSTSLEGAIKTYDYSAVVTFMTQQVRRFKPLVSVTQDTKGEYGHGGHMLLAKAVMEASDNSMDASYAPDSATQYGVWDVPKTYLHLYPENKIRLDLRTPLSNMGNQTAIDVATAAYLKHVSQQYCWFYVSDDYEYSCADFGLYRTTVGVDTKNDMLENITTYEEQERIAKEKAEAESRSIEESQSASIAEAEALANAEIKKEQHNKTAKSIILVVAILVVVIILIGTAMSLRARKHRRRRRR
jgi:LmbE family N-acetylglucosaminyl deacetylase